MIKKGITLSLNLLLLFIILVLFPIMMMTVLNINIFSSLNYLFYNHSIAIEGEKINLPAGFYLIYHFEDTDNCETFILGDIFDNSVMIDDFVGEYDDTVESSFISGFNESIRQYPSYGIYGNTYLYRLNNYEIYLYSQIYIQKSLNVVNVYRCAIPYNRMIFTCVGFDDEDYIINSIIKHIAFNKIDANIEFIEELVEP